MTQLGDGQFSLNQETYWNLNSGAHAIGASQGANTPHDGYMAEVNFIDGQALDPSYFGETDEDYGHWIPKRYSGTYGTNGFYLDFSNSGSIGEDQAGSNDWTANNLAATDVVLDSPTNNFCTLNPLNKGGVALSEGNLKVVGLGGWDGVVSTFSVNEVGKSYVEFYMPTTSDYSVFALIAEGDNSNLNDDGFYGTNSFSVFTYLGEIKQGPTNKANYSPANGDVVAFAIDSGTGTVKVYVNNTLEHTYAETMASGETYYIAVWNAATSNGGIINFGQDSSFAGQLTAQNNTDDNGVGDFYYAPPSGFLALCTANLPDPAVVPGENFNTVLWTGNGSTQSITGVGFQPDFVWTKYRSNVNDHHLFDVSRGATVSLASNSTRAETTLSQTLTAFNSDGFSIGTSGDVNASAATYVAWNWKADNTSGSTNTDGSITSTVAANPNAGFSIVSYTGTGSAATIGHGLSSAPEMVIIKNRDDGTESWNVFHDALGNTKVIYLNLTNASSTNANAWNSTSPTSSVFSVGTKSGTGGLTDDYIAYCFHSVDGYSKFGSYTGNGSSDGPFIYTGFRPAYIMVKAIDSAYSWYIWDAARDTYNVPTHFLTADNIDAETTTAGDFDLVSNGFKCRRNSVAYNSSGNSYIYMAFAEYPFKRTNAR